MNYRKYYKDYFRIEFGSEYAVHHIDFDKENNDINNLFLIPKKLHNKYHLTLMAVSKNNKHEISGIIEMEQHSYRSKMLVHYAESMHEISFWLDAKKYCYEGKYSIESMSFRNKQV